MKIENALVFFGFARRMIWRDRSGQENVETWQTIMSTPHETNNRAMGLFCTADKKTLYLVPWHKPQIEPINAEVEKKFPVAKVVYETWSKKTALEQIKIWFPNTIKKLDHCGFIKSIEYTSDKLDRKTDKGQYHLYTHDFLKEHPLFINCPMRPYMWGIQSETKLMSYRGLIG